MAGVPDPPEELPLKRNILMIALDFYDTLCGYLCGASITDLGGISSISNRHSLAALAINILICGKRSFPLQQMQYEVHMRWPQLE